MIWKRLHRSTPEQEKEFARRMSDENVPFVDKLIMVLTGFAVVVIPSLLVLVAMSFLVMWIFRAL